MSKHTVKSMVLKFIKEQLDRSNLAKQHTDVNSIILNQLNNRLESIIKDIFDTINIQSPLSQFNVVEIECYLMDNYTLQIQRAIIEDVKRSVSFRVELDFY